MSVEKTMGCRAKNPVIWYNVYRILNTNVKYMYD